MKYILIALILIPFTAFGNPEVLKICLTGSTEKALPKYGEAFVNGVGMAVRELSPEQRKRVEVSINYYDSNPLAPLAKLGEMRSAECDAIIGFSTGNDLLAVESALKADPVFTLSIYGDPQPRFSETSYLRTIQPSAQDLTKHLFEKLPVRPGPKDKVLVVTALDRSEMLAYKEAFLKNLHALKVIPTQVEVMEQTHDIQAFRDELKRNGKWDFVIFLTRSLIAAELTDLVMAQSQPIILGTKYFGSAELPAYLNYLKNKKVRAFISRQNCSCDPSPEFVSVREVYRKLYGFEPMSISIDSYDAAKFILKSLDGEDLSVKGVLRNLGQADFLGVSSLKIARGLKLSSSRRFLMEITEAGYRVVP
jgi:hypothetical protein